MKSNRSIVKYIEIFLDVVAMFISYCFIGKITVK